MRKGKKNRRGLVWTAVFIFLICSCLLPGMNAQADEAGSDELKIWGNIGTMTGEKLTTGIEQNAGASEENPKYPVFLLVIVDDSSGENSVAGYASAVYVQDTQGDGATYLITSSYAGAAAEQGYRLVVMQGDYGAEAEVVTSEGYITYLKADGVEDYPVFSIEGKWDAVAEDAMAVFLDPDDGEIYGYSLEDMDSWSCSGEAYDSGEEVNSKNSMLLGAPILDSELKNMGAIAALDFESGNLLAINMDNLTHPSKAAISGGTSSSDEGGQDSGDTEDDKSGDSDTKDEPEETDEEETGAFSDIPYWAWVIAVIVVAGVVMFRGNSKKGNRKNPENDAQINDSLKGETISLEPEAARTSEFLVRGVKGIFMGQVFPVNTTLRFGRSSQSDVMFPQGTKGISGTHCELSVENGRIALRDIGSSYGTYMGQGVKLVPNVVYYLNPGDEFYLADSTQTFCVENAGADSVPGRPGLSVKGTDGAFMGQSFSAGADGKLYFGRGEGAHVHFSNHDTGVSTSHCTLYQENGSIYLKDMNSTNGTFKDDGTRLKPNVPYRMNPGDRFYLVNRRNSFQIDGEQ